MNDVVTFGMRSPLLLTFGYGLYPDFPDPTPPSSGSDDICLGMNMAMIDAVTHTVLGFEVY